MTIDLAETSQQGSSPQELFLFFQGTDRWTFSGGQQPVVYMGETYAPSTISATEPDFSQEDDSTTIDVTTPADNIVAQRWAGLPPTLPLFLTMRRVHRTGQAVTVFSGKVTAVAIDGFQATFTIAPLAGMLIRSIPGLTYQTQCNWSTYGPDCGVSQSAFTDAVVISGAGGLDLYSDDFAARADGWYDHGSIQLRVGDRAGDVRYVVSHVGSRVTLNAPFTALMTGDTVSAIAGDDHLEMTCFQKFNNVARFMGFSRMPLSNPYYGRMA